MQRRTFSEEINHKYLEYSIVGDGHCHNTSNIRSHASIVVLSSASLQTATDEAKYYLRRDNRGDICTKQSFGERIVSKCPKVSRRLPIQLHE